MAITIFMLASVPFPASLPRPVAAGAFRLDLADRRLPAGPDNRAIRLTPVLKYQGACQLVLRRKNAPKPTLERAGKVNKYKWMDIV
jgi:hypothetical protein